VLTDRDPVRGRPTAEAAVDADPVDGAEVAIAIPLVGRREASRELGELDLEQIDHMPQPDQLLAELAAVELDRRPGAVALGRGEELGHSFPSPMDMPP
jgi:hypothetical protein